MHPEKRKFEQYALSVIKPLNTAKWQSDYRWNTLSERLLAMGNDYGGLELNPDFQRGHVWSPEQQLGFIQNCLRGVVSSNGYLIQFNCASWADDPASSDLPAGLQCLDGLQRFTAITEYMAGNVKPFGFTAEELVGTRFCPKKMHMKLAVHDFTRRADLLHHYLSLNTGGTPHSADEIERVRELLALAQKK